MSSRRVEQVRALGLVVAALLLRLAVLAVTDNAVSSELEAYSRINLMLQWRANPGLYPQLEFAPLHTYWLALFYLPFGRSVPAVRLATLLLSGVGLYALWDALRRLLGPTAALTGLALAGAAYIPAAVSTVSLAEGPALALLCVALSLFVRGARACGPGWGLLAASAAALNLAGAFRFELWAFIPLLSLALWRKPRAMLAYAALGLIFPLLHMTVCWYKLGDPLHSLHVPAAVAQLQELQKPALERLLGWPIALVRGMGWPIAALALLGLACATVARQARLLAWLTLPLTALLALRVYHGTMSPDLLRYTAVSVTLGCGLAAVALDPLFNRGRIGRLLATLLGAAALIGTGAHTVSSLAAQQREIGLGPGPRAAAALLQDEAGSNDLLLTDQSYHGFLAVESGLEIAQVRFAECAEVPASAPWEQQRDCLARDLQRKLLDLPATFLAADSSDAVLQRLIELNAGAIMPVDSNKRLEPAVSEGTFSLYRVVGRGR